MLNGRLYRAALVPVLLALAVAAFSLQARPAPYASSLAPDAFEGSRAFAELRALTHRWPVRPPGSAGDEAMARYVAGRLREMGSAGGGYHVSVRRFESQTANGARSLLSVIAQRPGAAGGSPIVLMAHRSAAAAGSAAELSGTAVLLELARVLASSETHRGIVIVSTSDGVAGAANLAGALGGPVDGVLALGDVAGQAARRPFVLPFSEALGSAPDVLVRTAARAIKLELGRDPGGLPLTSQLAHLALPLSAGEQGPLDAAGIPAVLMQLSGEQGPPPREPVSEPRLQAMGRAALDTVYALDGAPDLAGPSPQVIVQRKAIPRWAIALVALALLAAPLVVAIDGLARARRRRAALAPWAWWALSCALPFLACILFAKLLGAIGVIPAPAAPAPGALAVDARAVGAMVALAMALVACWSAWPSLLRAVGARPLPTAEAAAVPALLMLVVLALVVWLFNPFAALLLVPAAHLWLVLGSREIRPGRLGGLGLVVLGLLPAALAVALFASQLGMGPGEVAWSALTVAASAHLGLGATLAWSAALGCAAAAVLTALAAPAPVEEQEDGTPLEITTRGPLNYAGPGSLGGTESALRR